MKPPFTPEVAEAFTRIACHTLGVSTPVSRRPIKVWATWALGGQNWHDFINDLARWVADESGDGDIKRRPVYRDLLAALLRRVATERLPLETLELAYAQQVILDAVGSG